MSELILGQALLNGYTHVITQGVYLTNSGLQFAVASREAMEARQSELEAEGHKVLIVPTGGAHPLGFAAHVLTFKEMIEQSEAAGDRLDWIFHTAGTGTALPGLIAAKLLIDHPVRFLRRQRAGNH